MSFVRAILRSVLPKRVRELGTASKNRLLAKAAAARLAVNRVEVPEEGIFVSYGGQGECSDTNALHGGRVKLMHLLERYPEVKGRTNIVYLVSSALPHQAEELVHWAKNKGIKVVLNQNGVGYRGWAGDQYRQINEDLSVIHSSADFIVYQSEFCRTSVEKFLSERNCPFEVIPNCVDIAKFRPAGGPLDPTQWTLLTIGTHQQAERVIIPLRVVYLLKSRGFRANLIVAGKIDWPGGQQQVRETVRQLELEQQVEFIKSFSQNDAPTIYQRSHVLLHLKYKDPCPSVVIEALACGLPVIGSASGGMPELVPTEAGVLLQVEDTWDFMPAPEASRVADAVIKLMKERSARSNAARETAITRFGHEDWVARHEQIFNDLVGA